jgi:transcriptional regulator with XRE-family HTH domain
MTSDPLIALGKVIRQKRVERGWSVDEFAKQSRLSPKYIVAIEDGRRDELPEEAFLMGFLNLAAKSLKLDPSAIEQYKDMDASFILETIMNDETPIKIPYSYRYREPFFKIYHLYVLLAILVAFFIGTWVLRKIKPATTEIKAAPVALLKKAKLEVVNGDDIQVTTKPVTQSTGQHRLIIKVKRKAWIQVVALGQNNILFEGNLVPGSKALSFADDMGLYVSTSDAGAFDVDIGRGFYKFGARNQVVKWYYPPSAKVKYKEQHGSVL